MFIVGCINKINILKWMCETRSKEKFVWWGERERHHYPKTSNVSLSVTLVKTPSEVGLIDLMKLHHQMERGRHRQQ